MNLGFDAISQFPISQSAADNKVTINITGNNLTLDLYIIITLSKNVLRIIYFL